MDNLTTALKDKAKAYSSILWEMYSSVIGKMTFLMVLEYICLKVVKYLMAFFHRAVSKVKESITMTQEDHSMMENG